jgi:hypothetical protein
MPALPAPGALPAAHILLQHWAAGPVLIGRCKAGALLCIAGALLCIARALLCIAGALLCIAGALISVAGALICIAGALLIPGLWAAALCEENEGEWGGGA